jgi:uncharacterized protein YdhG (YjbR/CyaY superfamily)
MNKADFNKVDEYIARFPIETQKKLEQIRKMIKKTAPDAVETISYSMPAFRLNGPLVYYAAFKNHIGFYSLPTGNEAFKEELSVYKTGRGSVQFPLDKPIPLGLISEIVKFRVIENLQKVKAKHRKAGK